MSDAGSSAVTTRNRSARVIFTAGISATSGILAACSVPDTSRTRALSSSKIKTPASASARPSPPPIMTRWSLLTTGAPEANTIGSVRSGAAGSSVRRSARSGPRSSRSSTSCSSVPSSFAYAVALLDGEERRREARVQARAAGRQPGELAVVATRSDVVEITDQLRGGDVGELDREQSVVAACGDEQRARCGIRRGAHLTEVEGDRARPGAASAFLRPRPQRAAPRRSAELAASRGVPRCAPGRHPW